MKELFDQVVPVCRGSFAAATATAVDVVKSKERALGSFRVLVLLWEGFYAGGIPHTECHELLPLYVEWKELVQRWFGVGVETAKSKKRRRIDDVGSPIPFPDSLDAESRVLLNLLGIACQTDWDYFTSTRTESDLRLLSAFLGEKFHFAVETLNGTCVVCCSSFVVCWTGVVSCRVCLRLFLSVSCWEVW